MDFDEEHFNDDNYEESDQESTENQDDDIEQYDEIYDEMDPDEIIGLAQDQTLLLSPQGDIEEQNIDEEENTNPVTEDGNESDENTEDKEEDKDDVEHKEEEDEENDQEQQGTDQTDEERMGEQTIRTRSGREVKPTDRMNLSQLYLPTRGVDAKEYSIQEARVMSNIINTMIMQTSVFQQKKGQVFVQTYSLMKGMKKFGEKGKRAAYGEVKQLHDRVVFKPINVSDLTQLERKRATESLIFLTEKQDGRTKGRTCTNGSTQGDYVNREEAASPTAMTESHLITATIDAKEERDIMTADIPNAFVQTEIEEGRKGERIVIKIYGALVDMLVHIIPETYKDSVVYENQTKVLYVLIVKALYGMLQAALLYYKNFRADIEEMGFKVNPYDPSWRIQWSKTDSTLSLGTSTI